MELISDVNLDIKQRIKRISLSIEEDKVDGTELIKVSKDCLSTGADVDDIHDILELGHLSNVSRHMSGQDLIEP